MKKNQYEAYKQLYEVEKLDNNERIESFDCGDDDLNDFILNQAALYRNERLAENYALRMKESNEVIAYFSLANDKISFNDFEDKNKYNRFSRRFNNRKRLKSYPAVKIGRLGVSNNIKGRNVGSFIINFIKTYFVFNNKSGCRFLTVDAYSHAIPFYQKNGFVPLNESDAQDNTRLLYFDLKDVSE